MELKLPQPIPRDYDHLVRDIRSGICQIPRFQRDFVWDKQQAASLIDSIIKGFPIGAFILWKTKERMRAHKKFGGVVLETPPESDFVHYVLDGQQRLTSLFLAVQGIPLDGRNPGMDYRRLYADLNPEKSWDDEDALCVTEEPTAGIPIHQLVKGNWAELRALEGRYGREAADLADRMRESITHYKFATIEIQGIPLETVAEMFTRINTGGRELTLFEIVNAKVYQEDGGEGALRAFDLEEEIDDLTEELGRVSYDTLTKNKTVVLQAAAAIIGQDVRKKTILKINRSTFVDEWDEAAECLRMAVDKMRDYFRVGVSKLLPYPSLLTPIAYFYRLNKKRQPDNTQIRQISQFFFRAAFSRRYSSSVEAKLNQDLRLMEKIAGKRPVDVAKAIPLDNETEEFFVRQLMGEFRTSDAFVKAVLCIMAERGPKRLDDNSPVGLAGAGLTLSTSMNYHHFFPKSRVRGHSRANALANIILVDDYLNKRVIGNKMPSKYIGKFQQENPDIVGALDSHFIGMEDFVDDSGKDDFGKFLEKRAHRLARVILQKIGTEGEDAAAETAIGETDGELGNVKIPESTANTEKPELTIQFMMVPPPGNSGSVRAFGTPLELPETTSLEKAKEKAIALVKERPFMRKASADVVVATWPGHDPVAWATHPAAYDALVRMPKNPVTGLQKTLLPVNGVRVEIETTFWMRAPAKNRPVASPMVNFPKGDWATGPLFVGDDEGKLAGCVMHMPTLSVFRFWPDQLMDESRKPTLWRTHRGDRVKTDAEWSALLKEAPEQFAKLRKMLNEHPEL